MLHPQIYYSNFIQSWLEQDIDWTLCIHQDSVKFLSGDSGLNDEGIFMWIQHSFFIFICRHDGYLPCLCSFGRQGVEEYFFASHNIPRILLPWYVRIPSHRWASGYNSNNGLLVTHVSSILVCSTWWFCNREGSFNELIQITIPH